MFLVFCGVNDGYSYGRDLSLVNTAVGRFALDDDTCK